MNEPGVLTLRRPSSAELPDYVDALQRGWTPDNARGQAAAREHLERIAADRHAFIASQDDPMARAGPVTLPDGTQVERLPSYIRWLWDGEFCGSIGFRWRPGAADLPAHVLGHIGYAVADWKQGRGYATAALGLLLPDARAQGLPYVELTTDPANIASQRVILNNGGYLLETFTKPAAYGGDEALRYRIDLRPGAPAT